MSEIKAKGLTVTVKFNHEDVLKMVDELVKQGKFSPVIHAHWEADGERTYCSACRKYPEDFFETEGYGGVYVKFGDSPNYCPNCGARMDEEAEK